MCRLSRIRAGRADIKSAPHPPPPPPPDWAPPETRADCTIRFKFTLHLPNKPLILFVLRQPSDAKSALQYRMPSPAAWIRGSEAARIILEAHLADTGEYPQTVAVMMWGLDAIKTRGESVAIALALVGARPVKEATGRVVK